MVKGLVSSPETNLKKQMFSIPLYFGPCFLNLNFKLNFQDENNSQINVHPALFINKSNLSGSNSFIKFVVSSVQSKNISFVMLINKIKINSLVLIILNNAQK